MADDLIRAATPDPSVDDGGEAVPALAVAGVHKSYGATTALAGVDVQVKRGEFVVLLGPNGAGKTTLFQILAGLFVADRGRVAVDGIDIARHPVDALAKLGIVFQQPTLDPELSVRANLLFHARLHGIPRVEAVGRIATELARFGLGDRARDKAGALSGGNRRRLELARALLHRPRVLLMDEATVGLDPASRRDILERVAGLRDAGDVGILWSTHLIDEAQAADRIVVLDRGVIRFDGTPAGLTAATGRDSLEAGFLSLVGSGKTADA